ncbi:MAG: hypothetical protein ACE5QW_01545, partial [Thermoplasmata archaeon]
MQKAASRDKVEPQELLEKAYCIQGIDKLDARILGFTYETPKDMLTISTNLGIPIVECYTRARKLSSLGLLEKLQISSTFIFSTRKKTLFYANRDKVEVMVVDGMQKVKVRRARVPNGSI